MCISISLIDTTDVETCCFWGRGSLSIKGTCILGKLNYHLGKNKADREGAENAMFPDVDFCHDPGQICTGLNSISLRWISGLYHWMESVQKYDRDGFKYMDELTRYVNSDLQSPDFFYALSRIHLLGCHEEGCSDRTIKDMDVRLRNFEKVMALLGLQFGSHAKAESPFVAFPGQQMPTPPPSVISEDLMAIPVPTLPPLDMTQDLIVPVNVFLTGVLDGKNMTNDEQKLFEGLMYDMLVPRLETVDVKVIDVVIDHQIPNPEDFEAGSSFENSALMGDPKPVLQAQLNVTVSYQRVPEGLRDWSVYVKSWIESFGNTLVEIFTSPKHLQHPQTTSKFWDDLSDVSATNVEWPNTEPTTSPTPEPEPIIIYPDNSANTFIIAGVCAGVGLAICAFCVCFCIKLKQFRKLQSEQKAKQVAWLDDEESYQPMNRGADISPFVNPALNEPLDKVAEGSDDESSHSGSGTTISASEEETQYTNEQSAAQSEYTEDMEEEEEEEEEEESYVEEQSYQSENRSEYSKSVYDRSASSLRSRDYQSYYSGSRATSAPSSSEEDQRKFFDDLVERVLSNDPSLQQLFLDRSNINGHHFRSEDLWNAFVENNHIERLSLRECNLVDEDIASMSLALSESTNITHIWLSFNNITSEGVEYLISMLETNETIVFLDLAGNMDIDPALGDELRAILEPREDAYIAALIERVQNNDPELTELNFNSMYLGGRDDVLQLFDVLAGNEHVQAVDLSRNEIDDDFISSISLALMENTTITNLNLADNVLSSEGAEYLFGMFDQNKTIMAMDLNGNDIDPAILEEINAILIERRPTLVDCVESNDPNVTELNLSGINLIESSQTEALIDALAKNTHVTELILDNTEMDDTLVATLSLALVENTAITFISLRDNHITSEGCEYILGTLDSNTTITVLDLSGNQIEDHLFEEIEAILSQRQTDEEVMNEELPLSEILERVQANDPTLTEVVLDSRELAASSEEAEKLFDYLAQNNVVKKLSLCNNEIDDTLAAALSLALVENTSIDQVLLSDNQITSEGCEYLLGTLDTNKTLTYIELSGNLIEDRLMDEIDAINETRTFQSATRSTPLFDSQSFQGSAGGMSRGQSTLTSVTSLQQSAGGMSRGQSTLTSVTSFQPSAGGMSRGQSTLTSVTSLQQSAGGMSRGQSTLTSVTSRQPSNVSHARSRAESRATSNSRSAASSSRASRATSNSRSVAQSMASRARSIATSSNSARSSAASQSAASSAATSTSRSASQSYGSASKASQSAAAASVSSRSNKLDLSKPPCHEVPEESDIELAKRKAIQEIMKDTTIPWNEKNQRIIEAQKQFYVDKDGGEGEKETPQAAAAKEIGGAAKKGWGKLQGFVKTNIMIEKVIGGGNGVIDRIIDNDETLTGVNFDGQELGREEEITLFKALAENKYVISLSLVGCGIGNDGAAELKDTLKDNSTLTSINLQDNQITSNAAQALITVLREDNETLQHLDLSDNKVRSGLLTTINKLLESRNSQAASKSDSKPSAAKGKGKSKTKKKGGKKK